MCRLFTKYIRKLIGLSYILRLWIIKDAYVLHVCIMKILSDVILLMQTEKYSLARIKREIFVTVTPIECQSITDNIPG